MLEGSPFDWNRSECLLTTLPKTSSDGDFVRLLVPSPDGGLVLSITDNKRAEVINIVGDLSSFYYYQSQTTDSDSAAAELNVISCFQTAENICDIAWHPSSSISNVDSAIFASTMRDHPIHLLGIDGKVRSSYSPRNHLDELDSSQSLAFHPSGSKLYAGGEKKIRGIDLETHQESVFVTHKKGSLFGQRGLISSLSFNPDLSGAYSAGCFDGSVSVYVDNASGSVLDIASLGFQVAQTLWSPCGRYLFISGRKHDKIHCWDIRGSKKEIGTMEVRRCSQQRMSFSIDPWGSYLAAGDDDGFVNIFNCLDFTCSKRIRCSDHAVHSSFFHPYCGILTVGAGSRVLAPTIGFESDSECEEAGGAEDLLGALDSKRRVISGMQEPVGHTSGLQVWGLPFTPRPYPASSNDIASEVMAVDDIIPAAMEEEEEEEEG